MCVICFEDSGEHATLSCRHGFHYNCLVKWWISQYDADCDVSCPLCRFEPSKDETDYLVFHIFTRLYLKKIGKGKSHLKRWIQNLKDTWIPRVSMIDLLDASEYIPTNT